MTSISRRLDLSTTTLGRWWYVLRYYRTSQIARRIVSRCRKAVARLIPLDHSQPRPTALTLSRDDAIETLLRRKLESRPTDQVLDRANDVAAGSFCFLNKRVQLGSEMDWSCRRLEVSHLWRFQLQYQECLLDLIAAHRRTERLEYLDHAWRLVESWLSGPCGRDLSDPDAWHPYCISRRLPHWVLLWTYSSPPAPIANKVRSSLIQQADHLAMNLERDLRGNHLLENLKALMLAGCFFEGREAARWRATAESILRTEITEQIDETGEHFERSPMYHCHVMELLQDIADATRNQQPEISRLCEESAQRMARFIQPLLHPDGEFPLLADSCFGETPATTHLIDRILPDARDLNLSESGARSVGDYWVHRDQDNVLVFDAGPVGAEYLPAHAHCDLLTLEASLGGRRLFVDSGVFDYEDSDMRRYCRSTAAHNTLEIEGADQCDIWSRFRMGYRGSPGQLRTGRNQDFEWATCDHNAYRRLGAARVTRWLACRAGGPWICLDVAEGSGAKRVTQRLHLHPEVAVEKIGDCDFALRVGAAEARLTLWGLTDVRVEQGWYCPSFGVRHESPVIVWSDRCSLPSISGWVLQWAPLDGKMSVEVGKEGIPICWLENDRSVELFSVLDKDAPRT